MGQSLVLLASFLLNLNNLRKINVIESDVEKIIHRYNISNDEIRYAIEVSLQHSKESTSYLDSLFINLSNKLEEKEKEVSRLNEASTLLQSVFDNLGPESKTVLLKLYPMMKDIQSFLTQDITLFHELYNIDLAIVDDLKNFQRSTIEIMEAFNLQMSNISSYMINTDKLIMDLSNELFGLRTALEHDINGLVTDIKNVTAETNRVLKDLNLISNNDSAVLVNNNVVLSNSSIVQYDKLNVVKLSIIPQSRNYTYKVKLKTVTATYTGPTWALGNVSIIDNIVSNPNTKYSVALNRDPESEFAIVLPSIDLTSKFYIAIRTEASSVLGAGNFSCTFINRKLRRDVDVYTYKSANTGDNGELIATYIRTDSFPHTILDGEYNHFIYPSSVNGTTRPKLIEIKNAAVAPGLLVLEIGFVANASTVLASNPSVSFPSSFDRTDGGRLVIGNRSSVSEQMGDLVVTFPSLPVTITGVATFRN